MTVYHARRAGRGRRTPVAPPVLGGYAAFAQPTGPLPFPAPDMSNYVETKVVTATNATYTTASMWALGGDYIIDFQGAGGAGTPLVLGGGVSPYININFQRRARNVIIRGVTIAVPTPNFGAAPDGKGLTSAFPARRLTSTATGGTFKIRRGQASYFPYGNDLPYNCTAAQMQTEIDGLIGSGHVYVTGGPLGTAAMDVWPVTFDPEWGRLVPGTTTSSSSLLTTNLTGGTISGDTNVGNWPGDVGVFRLDNWTGELFIEGLHWYGDGSGEGLNPNSDVAGAKLTIQNSHIHAGFYRYHNDYQHPDGSQMYNGPAVVQIARSDLWSATQGMMLQSTLLTSMNIRDTYFRGGFNTAAPTRKGEFGIYCVGLADRFTVGQNTYTHSDAPSAIGTTDAHRRSQFVDAAGVPLYPWFPHYNAGANIQIPNLKVGPPTWTDGTRTMFADPTRGECGVGYVSPGYA